MNNKDEFKNIVLSDKSKVLIVEYSMYKDDREYYSYGISEIIVQGLDYRENFHESIASVADKNYIDIDDIQSYYADLEYDILKKFLNYVNRHKNYIWLHWDMNVSEHSFDEINHRFEKLTQKDSDDLPIFSNKDDPKKVTQGFTLIDIPINKKIDLNYFLETMYGLDYAKEDDRLRELINFNNIKGKENYLSTIQEVNEFEKNNFDVVSSSLRLKVKFLSQLPILINDNKLKVPKKSVFNKLQRFVSHPLTSFTTFIIAIIGAYVKLIHPLLEYMF